jgi:hypothetical protein
MKNKVMAVVSLLILVLLNVTTQAQGTNTPSAENLSILSNQVAYNLMGPKMAIVKSKMPLPVDLEFQIFTDGNERTAFSGKIANSEQVVDWDTHTWYSRIDFSRFDKTGVCFIRIKYEGKVYQSYPIKVAEQAIPETAIPAIVNFFYHQRASSSQEQEADSAIILFGSNKTVDLRGGWCDASGDVSKYFSHLAYTNFMLPQQIPMVTWSMVNTVERIPETLKKTGSTESLTKEACYGADYLMRSLSSEGYFYMTVFSYFDKNPKARRVVGLLADSKTTADYQCAYREGGGMAIAALARISQWKTHGEFSPKQYLDAAERAFVHLQQFSTEYADDGKDNIIDDYCALMAASELWKATGKLVYVDEARIRANNLNKRLSTAGYFIADDKDRPFWHAADAGLPVIALARYLDVERDIKFRKRALSTIKTSIDYNLKITKAIVNPFGYPRQSFLYKGKIQSGFFIPHENESGWWWQGEDARLGSLAAAVIVGGRLVYPGHGAYGVKPALSEFAANLVSWILGCNPYDMCMMYGYGKNNVPHMSSMYGHGSGKGGISNGITGKNGRSDGAGIDFKVEDNGNEWRWTEQWIPHTGWFLQAVTAMSVN